MKIFGKGLNIKAACFLAAFAVMGAGFLFREYLRDRSDSLRRDAYEHLTVSESAKALEDLSASLSYLTEGGGSKNALLSEIRLNSSLALSALAHISFEGSGSGELFSYLSAVSEISRLALELGISEEAEGVFFGENAPSLSLFSLIGHYAERINTEALPHLGTDNAEFESSLTEIFSDTVLETVLYEGGFGSLAAGNGFSSIGGGLIDEKSAMSLAKKHLAKNAYLTARLSEGEIPVYHVGGKNISALITAKSGFLMQLLFDIPEGEERIDENEAKAKAEIFLGETGLGGIKKELASAEHTSGLYIFEYAPIQNGVLCLDERILVGVSHGSGRICLFDAVDYYRYHKKALKLPQGLIPSEKISEKFAASLPPILCKIERRQGIESLCYRVEGENGRFFVSAISGARIED